MTEGDGDDGRDGGLGMLNFGAHRGRSDGAKKRPRKTGYVEGRGEPGVQEMERPREGRGRED